MSASFAIRFNLAKQDFIHESGFIPTKADLIEKTQENPEPFSVREMSGVKKTIDNRF